MNNKKHLDLLMQSCMKNNYITIYRDKIDENEMSGIPLFVNKEIVLIQYIYDFDINGFKVLRIADITQIKRNETDKFEEMILRNEGLYQLINKPDINICDSIFDILSELYKQDKIIIVECEEINRGKFYIGKIAQVGESLFFKTFDMLGEWDEDLAEINYDDITSITFNSRYIKMYSKYLK